MQVRSNFVHLEHNGENKILNEYNTTEINHFKVLLLCKMMSYDVGRMLMWHKLIRY
jgi:hypothetical protein